MKILIGYSKDLKHWEQIMISNDIQATLSKHGATMMRTLFSPNGMIFHVELDQNEELFMERILKEEFSNLNIMFVKEME